MIYNVFVKDILFTTVIKAHFLVDKHWIIGSLDH